MEAAKWHVDVKDAIQMIKAPTQQTVQKHEKLVHLYAWFRWVRFFFAPPCGFYAGSCQFGRRLIRTWKMIDIGACMIGWWQIKGSTRAANALGSTDLTEIKAKTRRSSMVFIGILTSYFQEMRRSNCENNLSHRTVCMGEWKRWWCAINTEIRNEHWEKNHPTG